MLLKALHGFCIGGGVDVAPDQEFDASPNMAAQWISSGAAILSPERDANPTPVPITMDGTDDGSGLPATTSAPTPIKAPEAPAPAVVTTSAPKGQKEK